MRGAGVCLYRTAGLRHHREMRRSLFVGSSCLVWLAMLPSVASASDIVEVLPLTDRIVMVHFDDGKVTLAKPGQSGAAGDVVTVDALDRTLASSAQSYKV